MTVSRPVSAPSPETVQRVARASGRLATAVIRAMDARLLWFSSLPADQRSWVGLVAQAGIAAFVGWLRRPHAGPQVSDEVFAAAPRELTGMITLEQTVELVRVTVDVVESEVPRLAAPGDEAPLREAMLRFSREVAFAAARVYARAAEQRGAWDARLEALVVDALLRGAPSEEIRSRAAALGWGAPRAISVVVGEPRPGDGESVVDGLQRAARLDGLDLLAAVQGRLLVVVLGAAEDPLVGVGRLLPEFGAGPVVVGPTVRDLAEASRSARAGLAALRVAPAWPTAPRPVPADALLPERALDGDEDARRTLLGEIYTPLVRAGSGLIETVSAYLEAAGSTEGTARALFVHPNTVRYRLRRVSEVCGRLPGEPRDGLALQVALILGRIATSRGEL